MKVFILLISLIFRLEDPFLDTASDIVAALNKGNSAEISKFFSDRVDLKILDKEDLYSKSQAESILKDFFSKRIVKSFKESHSSSAKSANQFVVGILDTNSGRFRVSFFLKKTATKYQISQFRIESFNE